MTRQASNRTNETRLRAIDMESSQNGIDSAVGGREFGRIRVCQEIAPGSRGWCYRRFVGVHGHRRGRGSGGRGAFSPIGKAITQN
jgi:hypothetical protein